QQTTNTSSSTQQDENPIILSPITDNNASNTPSSTPYSNVASSTPASSTPPVATPEIKVKDTPTGYLNVRATPSSAGTLVTQVHPGEIYPFSDKSKGWYKITLTDGSFGWVS